MNIVQHAAKHRRLHAPLQEVERLNERHAGLQQRRQFLVEYQKLALGHRRPLRQSERQPADRTLGLEGEDEQPFFVEIVAQSRLAVGRKHPFGDFARWRCDTTPELHELTAPERYRSYRTNRWFWLQQIVRVEISRGSSIPIL